MLLILITSVTGMIFSVRIHESYQDLACASIEVVDTFANGSENWVGINKLSSRI